MAQEPERTLEQRAREWRSEHGEPLDDVIGGIGQKWDITPSHTTLTATNSYPAERIWTDKTVADFARHHAGEIADWIENEAEGKHDDSCRGCFATELAAEIRKRYEAK